MTLIDINIIYNAKGILFLAINYMRNLKRPPCWGIWFIGAGSLLLIIALTFMVTGFDCCLTLPISASIFIALGIIISLDLPDGD